MKWLIIHPGGFIKIFIRFPCISFRSNIFKINIMKYVILSAPAPPYTHPRPATPHTLPNPRRDKALGKVTSLGDLENWDCFLKLGVGDCSYRSNQAILMTRRAHCRRYWLFADNSERVRFIWGSTVHNPSAADIHRPTSVTGSDTHSVCDICSLDLFFRPAWFK